MKTTGSVRTAVIGVGNMGKHHARVYSEISRLCAVSDTDSVAGRAIASKFHAAYYTDYRVMLDREKPDAVSVVVPTALHRQIVEQCLIRKIPTLVEKPIASDVSDAERMIDSAKKTKTYLLVGHIERYNPAVQRLKILIRSNKIGKLISLLSIRVGISPPAAPHANVIADLGIHDVDICNYLLGEFPDDIYVSKQKIFAHSDVDSGSLHLTYHSCRAVIITNWVTPIKIRKLYATGTKGFIELDYLTQKIIYYSKINNLKMDGNFTDFISLTQTPKKELYISKKEPLREELLYFLIHKKDEPDYNSLKAATEALRIVST